MNRTQSKSHRIGTSEITKISSSCFDDKRYMSYNGIDVLELNNNIILIFPVVRTHFFFVFVFVFCFTLYKTFDSIYSPDNNKNNKYWSNNKKSSNAKIRF